MVVLELPGDKVLAYAFNKYFDDVINDETSVNITLELLCAWLADNLCDSIPRTLTVWRQQENFWLIGDDFQLKPPVFTGSEENPFY